MYDLYLCVTRDHRLSVLALAVVVCAVSAIAGFCMFGRSRVKTGVRARAWLAAAVLIWGGGAWATHFVAMLGYEVGLPMRFDLALTMISAAAIALFAAAGFGLLAKASSPRAVAGAGALLGLGVAVMHFIGMAGLRMPAAMVWDLDLIAAAIVFSICFGAAMTVIYAAIPRPAPRVAAASLLSVIAVCMLHFTAMTALTPIPESRIVGLGVSVQLLAVIIAAGALLLIVVGLAATVLDVVLVERRMAEETRLRALVDQLRESEARAQEANRAKSSFLSRMSHEFRTPLNGVIGIASMLQPNVSREQAEMLRLVVSSGKTLGGMIDDLLVLARLEDGDFKLHPHPFQIDRLLEEIDQNHRAAAEEKGLCLTVRKAPGVPETMTGDPDRIAQLIKCLVSNAIKFTPQGQVRILVRARGGEDAQQLRFIVEDTGIGVPRGAEEQIFDQFGQADSSITRRHDGAGLGLTLARMLCDAMGGELSLERLAEGGSRFVVSLPMDAAGSNAPAAGLADVA